MSITTLRRRGGLRIGLVPLLLGVAFGAVPLAVAPLSAAAGGSTTGFALLGCRGSESLLPPAGPYVCPDADYVAGNVGNGWNELDLVPFRFVATAGGQSVDVALTGGALDKLGVPGFDFMSLPVLNAASSPSCKAPAVSPSGGAGATISPGVNNSATSIYRVLSLNEPANTTYIFDFYMRLALGSHANNGSSLHADLASPTITDGVVTELHAIPGAKTVPVPVEGTSLAPSLAATLTATQDTGYSWTLNKSSQPAALDLVNTCDPKALTQPVDVTITWTRVQAATGDTAVVVQLLATNPNHRNLSIDIADTLRNAASQQVGQHDTGSLTVPANSSHYLVATSTYSFPAGSSASYSDSASGVWTDPVTHSTLLTTPAAASGAVQIVPGSDNATATVSDTTGLTGSSLRYSLDSASLAGGSTGSYVLGTPTTGAVTWTSPQLSGSGSTTLHFTVSASGPSAGSGSLDDTAGLVGSSGQTLSSPLSVKVSTGALFGLTIQATIPNVLTGAQTATFAYTVTDSHGNQTPASLVFSAGQSTQSVSLGSLGAGGYTVHQTSPSGWVAQADQVVTAATPRCSYTVTFANALTPVPTPNSTPTPTPTGGTEGTGSNNGNGGNTPNPTPSPKSNGNTEPTTTTSNSTPAPSVVLLPAGHDAISAPDTGAGPGGDVQAAVATPFTGADLPLTEGGLLILVGGAISALGWWRRRPSSTR